MVMELLPPGDEERMNYCCWYKGQGINSWAALIFKDPSCLQTFFYFLSGLEEFMKKQSWGALGHILVAEASYFADNIHKCYDLALLHKILLAGRMDE
jgi:hypothetical protein